MRWFFPTLAVVMLFFLSRVAWAEPDAAELAIARSLFEDARAQMAAGQYAAACPKLERALRILPVANGTKFNLATCYEHVDRTASAWGLYLDVANAEQLAGHDDRERAARDAAYALAPRVPHLSIVVRSTAPRMEILRDGTPLDVELVGEAIPLDPGPHVVEARAPGRRGWLERVMLTDGQSLRVDVPELDAIVVASVPVAAAATKRPYLATALSLGASGLVWLGVGGSFLGVSLAEYADANATYCSATTNGCSDVRGISLRDESITHGNIATAAFALGLASVAAAIVVALLPPSLKSSPVGLGAQGLMATW